MLKVAGLPVEFWAEAAQTHIYITNRIRGGPTLTKIVGENKVTKCVCHWKRLERVILLQSDSSEFLDVRHFPISIQNHTQNIHEKTN